ncbi:MAG: hypothetical protein ACKOCX_11765 [Planctomycetota bacterium]
MIRSTLVALAFTLVLPPLSLARPLRAAEPAAEGVADLAARLTTGLRVKAPADVAFCERVAGLVRDGRLPVEVVDATYTWAIARGKKYPFPAFEHVMRLKATKLGVPL